MYKEIGQRIRRLRIEQHLTQEKLAEMTGISLSFLGHIERGTRKMSVETLCNLTDSLRCSADELLGIDIPSNASSPSDELSDIIDALKALKRRFQ